MFDSEEEFDEDFEKILKKHNINFDMETNTIIYVVLTFGVLVMLLGCCLRRKGGRYVRSQPDPPPRAPPGPAPAYPQQQYLPHTGPVVTGVYPVAQVAIPYPAPAPYPTYPAGMPVPTHPGHYPQGFVPGRSPYPPASYPAAPSAPDASAMPPTYEQAVCARPYAPH